MARSHRSSRASLRWAAAIAAVASMAAGVAGCSSDEIAEPTSTSTGPIPEGEAPVRVELIDEAVAAVEGELGGPQRYFEINASPTVINLFVALDGATQAVAYVFALGELNPPAEAVPASGPTFLAADATFDTGLVLAKASAELITSEFRLFSITATDDGAPQYRAVVQSTQGSEFVVYLSGSGAILGTDQNLDIPAGEGNS